MPSSNTSPASRIEVDHETRPFVPPDVMSRPAGDEASVTAFASAWAERGLLAKQSREGPQVRFAAPARTTPADVGP